MSNFGWQSSAISIRGTHRDSRWHGLSLAIHVGIFTGLCDATILWFNILDCRGLLTVPPIFWVIAPLVWTGFCVAVTVLLVPIPCTSRLHNGVILCCGPGLLLVSRLGPLLKNAHSLHGVVAAMPLFLCVVAGALILLVCSSHLGWRSVGVASSVFVFAVTLCNSLDRKAAISLNETNSLTRRDVVLIFLDTVRYDDAQAMPNLRELANRSIQYTNAWASCSWTLPSHFSVLTGLQPWTVPFDDRAVRFDNPVPTLAERFAAAGYSTAAVFANPLLNPGTGLDRGFQHFECSWKYDICRTGLGFLVNSTYTHLTNTNQQLCSWMTASDVTHRAVGFVKSATRPYFLALNYIDPHDPYSVEPACREREFKNYSLADWKSFTAPGGPTSPASLQRIHSQYRLALRCVDRSLGVLFQALQKGPDGNRPIIVVVGDHGEQFGEHRIVGHGNSLYQQVLHIPLIVNAGERTPLRVSEPVEIDELYFTILSLAGFPTRRRGLLEERRRPLAISYLGPGSHTSESLVFSFVGRRYHLMRWQDGREEIYDYVADPTESRPLSKETVSNEIVDLRRSALQIFDRANSDRSGLYSLDYLH